MTTVGRLCWKPIDNDGTKCGLLDGHLVPCSANDAEWVELPTEPFSEIAPGLFMGGSYGDGLLRMSAEEMSNFDSILTCYAYAPIPPEAIDHYEFHFEDTLLRMPNDAALTRAVDWAYEQWTSGHRVLIRCQGGLNRSGLVTALVLRRTGLPADEAIDLVRAKRSPYALCNTVFVDHLMSI